MHDRGSFGSPSGSWSFRAVRSKSRTNLLDRSHYAVSRDEITHTSRIAIAMASADPRRLPSSQEQKRRGSVILVPLDRQVFLDLAIGIEDLAGDFHARVIIDLPKRPDHIVAT